MYKRAVRLLFVHRFQDAASARAALDACTAHARWIEARNGCVDEDLRPLLDWADLVLTLGDCPLPRPLPPHVQHRHWPDLDPQALEARVDGVVGGLRLLSRVDGDGLAAKA